MKTCILIEKKDSKWKVKKKVEKEGGESSTEMIFEQRPKWSHDVSSGWKVFQAEEPSCTKVLWQR